MIPYVSSPTGLVAEEISTPSTLPGDLPSMGSPRANPALVLSTDPLVLNIPPSPPSEPPLPPSPQPIREETLAPPVSCPSLISLTLVLRTQSLEGVKLLNQARAQAPFECLRCDLALVSWLSPYNPLYFHTLGFIQLLLIYVTANYNERIHRMVDYQACLETR